MPVQVCAQSQDWRRLHPEDMARTVWRDGRYVDFATGTVNDRVLAYYTHHFFFVTTSSLDGVGKLLDWSGLTAGRVPACIGSGPAFFERREVVVYTVAYRVVAADLAGSTLTLTVEPNSPALDRGYSIVQVPRPGGSWYARFVLRGGRGGPLADLNAGRVTVELPAESDPVGALLVSLTLEYAADLPRLEEAPPQRLPRSGGTAPASAGLSTVLGLTLLAVSRLVRR